MGLPDGILSAYNVSQGSACIQLANTCTFSMGGDGGWAQRPVTSWSLPTGSSKVHAWHIWGSGTKLSQALSV